MREITSVSKKKVKKIYQMTPEEFRSGKWCSDRSIVPDGNFVELSYTSRNGILVVHNTVELNVKTLEDKNKTEKVKENGKE